MSFFEVVTALMVMGGGFLCGGVFGSVLLQLLFGKLRLNHKFAAYAGGVMGAALGVCFALVVVQGFKDHPYDGPVEQPDEDRWIRP